MERTGSRFKYQKLLDVKEQRERVLKLEIARLSRAVMELEEAGRRWMRLRKQAQQKLREARAKAETELDGQYTVYLEYLRVKMRQCSDAVGVLEASKKRTMEEAEQIMRSRKLLEEYKERMLKEIAARQEKAEERVLDSHSLQKFIGDEVRP